MNKKLFLLAYLSLTASIFSANNYIHITNDSMHEVEVTIFDTKDEEGNHFVMGVRQKKLINLYDACATKLSVKRGPGIIQVKNTPSKTVLKINKNECRTRSFYIEEGVNGLVIKEGSKSEVAAIEKAAKSSFFAR